MAKLFVSYSRRDSVAARKLIEVFRSIEQDVWVDWESIPPATDWLEQIFRGIEAADAFLFLISPDSIASEVCKVELNKAVQNNKRIIPIVLRDVHPKDTPESISKLNWTFMRETDTFEEGLAKVKTAIELDLDWLEEHRRLQVRALEWHRKKDVSLLLRGRDLRNARHMVATATSKDPTPTELQKTYILYSQKNERNRNIAWAATGIALVIMAVLSLIAVNRSNEAQRQQRFAEANADEANIQAIYANQNRKRAERNAEEANRQRKAADEARAQAEENENQAEAQRSAARAQIYQSRPGELYTSTLLAIDSMQHLPSVEAEEILRRNISLLPLPVAQISQAGKINALEFNPQGDAFATAGTDGSMCMWNVVVGKELFCKGYGQSVNDIAFSLDGTLLVTGDASGLVEVWDVQTQTVKYVYQRIKPESAVSNLQIVSLTNSNSQNAYTPLGIPVRNVSIRPGAVPQLAIAYDDGKIPVVDLRTGKLSSPLEISGRPLVSGVSPSSTFLAAGSENGTLTIWNLSDKKSKIISNVRHRSGVLAMEFSPDRRTIATAGKDNTAVLIDLRNGTEFWRLINQNWVRDLAFSPDGSWLVTVSDDHRIRIWDVETGKERIGMLQDGIVTDVTVSSNGQWIATTGEDETVRVWDSTTGAEIFQIPLEASGSGVAFSKDSKYLVSVDQGGSIDIWDISVMAVPEKTVQFNGIVRNVQYSPNGDQLAVSDENRVWLLNPEPLSSLAARQQGTSTLRFESNVRNLIFSPDSKLVGVQTEENGVAIYNTETRTSVPLQISSQVQSIAFSPDRQLFITSDADGNTQAWNALDGTPADSADESAAGVLLSGRSVLRVLSPDGSLLASSDASGQVTISKYENGQYTDISKFVKDQAASLAFNADGSILAVGTARNVSFMDVTTGKEFARIPHSDTVNGVSFSADGTYLATASSKVLQFWDVTKIDRINSNGLLDTACSRLLENFDTTQWTTLFGTEKYRTLCEKLRVPEE